jgi:predicted HicB family RNase H-like nuclease
VKDYFEYKGYLGSAEVDIEGGVLAGKLLFIRDVIAYSATTPVDLEAAFKEAVEDYLSTCAELGDEPDVPCKGTFNVRVGADIHRQVALTARSRNMGLNEFVRDALAMAVSNPVQRHQINLVIEAKNPSERISTPANPPVWESVVSYGSTH